MRKVLYSLRRRLQRALIPELARLEQRVSSQKNRLEKLTARQDSLADLIGEIYMEQHRINTDEMTPQERAWYGRHGFRYIVHHLGEDWRETRVPYWSMILERVPDIGSVCEFGANIGANLKAIRHLRPDIQLHGVEVNAIACDILRREGFAATRDTVAEVSLDGRSDLVFSRGVLIHVKPSELHNVLRRMGDHSSRYVLIYENYSAEMESLDVYADKVSETVGEVSEGYQFWADFAGEFATLHPDWKIECSGVDLTPNREPRHGDLAWTIFRRPETS